MSQLRVTSGLWLIASLALASSWAGAAGQTGEKSAMTIDEMSTYQSSELLQQPIFGNDSERLGMVSDFVIEQDGSVGHVILSTDAGDHYAVPWDRLSILQDRLEVDASAADLSSEFAAFEMDAPSEASDAVSDTADPSPEDRPLSPAIPEDIGPPGY